jgi:hypothetical protein
MHAAMISARKTNINDKSEGRAPRGPTWYLHFLSNEDQLTINEVARVRALTT